jgi:hypothetical protein
MTMNDTRDKQVQDTASLHEKAVQAVAKGAVAPRPRKARKKAEKRNHAVHKHVVVDPRVMKAAKELLIGSYTRIEIVDAETVRVR